MDGPGDERSGISCDATENTLEAELVDDGNDDSMLNLDDAGDDADIE